MGSPVWNVPRVAYTTKNQPPNGVLITDLHWECKIEEGSIPNPPAGPRGVVGTRPEFSARAYGTAPTEPMNRVFASLASLQAVTKGDFINWAKEQIDADALEPVAQKQGILNVAQIEHRLENEIAEKINPTVGSFTPT